MKKKKLVSIIIIFTLAVSTNIFAVSNVNINQEDTSNFIKESSSSTNEENLISESEVTFEYNKDEQKTMEAIPDVGCKAAYLVEPKTGKIIYEKNAHEKMYPASTTKILTALVVLEKCKLNDVAVVSKNAINLVPFDYANAKLQVGEKLNISDLLYALLVQSANEAANVLAEHVSGSIDDFMELCNNRAKELGCESLHFVNPNGIHSDNHYCTAYDLYIIARECQKYDIFNKIVKTDSFTLPATNAYSANDRTFENTNSLILSNSKSYYYPYCTGIKTGHTDPAGQCLIASSSHDSIDLISVVLGGKTVNSNGLNDRFIDTKHLYEFTYNNYSYKKIAEKNQIISNVTVKDATKDTASLDMLVNSDISTIMPNNVKIEDIQKVVDMDSAISAPIKENQVIGKVTFKVDGLNYTADIIASHEVKRIPYWLYNSAVILGVLILFLIISKFIKRKKKRKYRR